MMQLTAWIEVRCARGANGAALQVLVHRKPMTADTAKYRLLLPQSSRPDLGCMVRYSDVAIVTRIPTLTAIKPNRDNIEVCAVVLAARLRINIYPKNCFAFYLNLQCEDNAVPAPETSKTWQMISRSSLGAHTPNSRKI